MIYAVDFDGTLSMGQWPEVGPANTRLLRYLWTSRGRVTSSFSGPAGQESLLIRQWNSAKKMASFLMP